MKSVALMLFAALLVPVVFAKEEMKPFEKPADRVYQAVVTVAAKQGAIIYSDKETRILTFKSGGYCNKRFEVQAVIEAAGESKSLVTVKTDKTYIGAGWGAASRITKDFFADLDKALK